LLTCWCRALALLISVLAGLSRAFALLCRRSVCLGRLPAFDD
jgi:hypothetical protein